MNVISPGSAAPSGGPAGPPGTRLPRARSVLAVVGRPGDEAYYLGAVLDAFRAGGTSVSALVFTRGEAAPSDGGSGAKASTRPFEFEVSSLMLRITHRLMIDYPGGDLDAIPEAERVRRVTGMIRRCSADLLLTAEAAAVDPLVIETACAAGRAAGIPVLAWTLPADVADEVCAAGGLSVPDRPRRETDFALRVSRTVQRRAIRAHSSQANAESAQVTRLDVQRDREWLNWLVLPGLSAPIERR